MAHESTPKGKTLTDTTKAPTGHQGGPQEQQTGQGKHPYSFIANEALHTQLEGIAQERRRSKADTVRMLVYMGLESYNNNRAAGITTSRQAAQQAAKQRAGARAEGQRKRAAQSRRGAPGEAPAVTAILLDDAQGGGA